MIYLAILFKWWLGFTDETHINFVASERARAEVFKELLDEEDRRARGFYDLPIHGLEGEVIGTEKVS